MPLYFPGTFSDVSLNTSVLILGEISLPVLTLFLVPKAIAGSVIITSAVIGLFDPFGLGAVSHALALTIATIVLWATGVVAEFKTSMLFYTLAMLFSIAPADVVFAGFSAGATWLIFSGLVIGVGINSSGLGERIAKRLSALFGGTYNTTVLGILIITLVLGFILPSSMGRVVLVMPIAIALARALGHEPETPGYIGITLAAGFGCFFMPFGILPANIPNMVLLGIVEDQFDFSLIYGDWFVLHFPFISGLKVLFLWGLIVWLFPTKGAPKENSASMGSMSRAEWKLTIILTAALLAWATDFLHGVSPAWVGMVAAVLFMTPGFGNVTSQDFVRINFSVIFYVAAILGIGSLVNHSGLGNILAENMSAVLPLFPEKPFQNYMTIALTGIAMGTFTAAPGVPILMTPIAEQMAQASGFSLLAVLMLQALSFSTTYLVYQSAPVVIAMGLAGVRLADGTKLMFLLALLSVVVIFPLNFIWWRILGWI